MSDSCWYQERWYDGDLEEALCAADLPVTEENVNKLRAACCGIFDDKSERNEILRQKAEEVCGEEEAGDVD